MTETMSAITTRSVTFRAWSQDKIVRDVKAFPAGTEVYVGRIRSGRDITVRIPGTLYEQDVTLTSLDVP